MMLRQRKREGRRRRGDKVMKVGDGYKMERA